MLVAVFDIALIVTEIFNDNAKESSLAVYFILRSRTHMPNFSL